MPIFDLIWVFMNSGCVLGNIEQKIFIKKIAEADQLNFKVSLVRPKLVSIWVPLCGRIASSVSRDLFRQGSNSAISGLQNGIKPHNTDSRLSWKTSFCHCKENP